MPIQRNGPYNGQGWTTQINYGQGSSNGSGKTR